jgi:hypothetical protein
MFNNSLIFCFLCVSVLCVLCNGILASLKTFRDRARFHLLNRREACFHETALAKDVTKVGEQNLSSRGIEPRSLQPQCRILTTVRTRPIVCDGSKYMESNFTRFVKASFSHASHEKKPTLKLLKLETTYNLQ